MDYKDKSLYRLLKTAQEEYSLENYVVVIPNIMSKQFTAYNAMRADLNLILDYIQILKNDECGVKIKSSLTYSLIALYGKCFTDASKDSYPKLEPKSIFRDNDTLVPTHDYLMDLRHKFIAHRGDTDLEIGISFILVPKETKDKSQLKFKSLKLNSFSIEKLEKIEKLINFIILKVDKSINKSGQKLHKGFFDKFTIKQIPSMTINNLGDIDD